MKTLNDIKQDMSELYDLVKAGQVDLKTAGELANISGKFLKAEQLELAKDIFMNNKKLEISHDA
jgi:tyrosine-protein phosphatase YwqE